MQLIKRKEVNISKDTFSYLHLENEIKGKNIFFFHATGFNAETYSPFFLKLDELLAHEYSIYALDQRGHGLSRASAIPSDLTSWRTYFSDAKEFVDRFKTSENVVMGHSMGAVVASKISFDLENSIKKSILIDPVLQPQSLSFQLPFFNISNKLFIRLMSYLKKNRATEMINNAKKRRSIFTDKDDIFNHYTGRGAFKNWPEDFLRAYINGGTKVINNQTNLSCVPEWEAKTFAVSYVARTKFISKIKNSTYVPYASEGSTFSLDVRERLKRNPNYIFEEINGSHFFPMEKKDLICEKISTFINS